MAPKQSKFKKPDRSGGLGPAQIAWLRDHIKPFDRAWTSVQNAEANASRIRAELASGLRVEANR